MAITTLRDIRVRASVNQVLHVTGGRLMIVRVHELFRGERTQLLPRVAKHFQERVVRHRQLAVQTADDDARR